MKTALKPNRDLQPPHRDPGATPRTRTRAVLVHIGTEIASERGFNATGIDTVLRRAGIPKGSFYYYFRSKDDFGLAVIDNYAEYFAQRLHRIFQDRTRTPLEQLDAFIDSGSKGLRKYDFKRGCLVGSMGQEMANLNEDIRHRLESTIRQWEVCIECCLQSAQLRNEVRSEIDAGSAAKFFWVGWEGAILRAKLAKSTAPIRNFRDQFFLFLAPAPRETRSRVRHV